MSLFISTISTIIAVVTACVTIGYLFWREWQKNNQPARTSRHIPCTGEPDCICWDCEIDRILDEDI